MNAIEVTVAIVAPWAVVLFAYYLQGRITKTLLETIASMQRDHATLVSEMLAHKTLVETGNQFLAGQMLQHSNAHDFRAQPPAETTRPVETVQPQGPHESPEILYGSEGDDMVPPGPGEPT